MSTTRIRRACFVRLSAMGDVCLCLPALQSLRLAFPGVEITWVIGRAAHSLVRGLPGFNFVVLDKGAGFSGYVSVLRQLRKTRFDALLCAQASFRSHWLYPFIKADRKIGFDRARARDAHQWFVHESVPEARLHLADGFFQFVGALGVGERMISTILPISRNDRLRAREWLGKAAVPTLAVNPAASKVERNWPADRYAAVIRHAHERWSARIVLTGGPGHIDAGLRDVIRAAVPARIPMLDLVGRTTPLELAAVLQNVDALVAPDTGPIHLADAVETPVIALFAVIHAGLSGPYRDRRYVVDRHTEAMRKFMGREPGPTDWLTRVHDARAMELIRVEDVTLQVDRVLGEGMHHRTGI